MGKEKIYELGQSYIRFNFKASDEFKIALEKYLLYKGRVYTRDFFHKDLVFDEFYFAVETEDGSLKARLRFFGKIAIGSIVAFGGIRSGVDYLIQDSRRITNHIVRDLTNEPNINPNSIGRVERRLGVPGKLKRLYNDIEHLQNNRENLTEQEQTYLINRISRRYNGLINDLDQPVNEYIENDLRERNIYPQIRHFNQQNQPIPENEYNLPRLRAIRRDEEYQVVNEILLIGEEEIDNESILPPPN